MPFSVQMFSVLETTMKTPTDQFPTKRHFTWPLLAVLKVHTKNTNSASLYVLSVAICVCVHIVCTLLCAGRYL